MKHLWEYTHPYYGDIVSGNRTFYESWDSFADSIKNYSMNERMLEDKGNFLYDGDVDQNFLFRWDWKHADHYNAEEAVEGDCLCGGDIENCHILKLYYSFPCRNKDGYCEIWVTVEDEPKIKEWLISRAEIIKYVWAPLL